MADSNGKEVNNTDNSRDKVTLSGRELIILVIFTPGEFTWLFLAARIVWENVQRQATRKPWTTLRGCSRPSQ